MSISDWLDEQAAENADLSGVELPADMLYDEDPEETIFFEEINHCGILCAKNHPYASVERFGHWYYCRGQDRQAGIHSADPEWRLLTRNKALALQTAKSHIE